VIRTVRRREAGGTAHAFVLAFTVVAGAVVLGSEATVGAFHRSVVATGPSDQAFALAEAGLALAKAELARDASFAGRGETPLGPGRFSVAVERAGDRATITATGTTPAPLSAGPGGKAIRRIRAVLRLGGGAPTVLSWKEL
jgi:hypothetical protein